MSYKITNRLSNSAGDFIVNKIPFKVQYYLYFWLLICLLVVLQDYVFAILEQTPFYWSEVLLFKIYWILFIPFSLSVYYFNIRTAITKQNLLRSIPKHILFSVSLTFIQFFIFAFLVSGLSHTFSKYPFDFLPVFINSLARDFYISILVYGFLILIQQNFLIMKKDAANNEKNLASSLTYDQFINVRKSREIIPIDINTINWIGKEGTYVAIHSNGKKYLHNLSLSKIQHLLDPGLFVRIHRSTIINIKVVDKLKSRSNGDYDVLLKNGEELRLSRNFRKNLNNLL
ncbi:MAG TPA: LytTR family DNA-binding domain-containing protein [Ignavibacteriaceae bacterium]|nr:LytTR family DNA-binding domain-containing protein [Ignavibacteriaceae bacterium]